MYPSLDSAAAQAHATALRAEADTSRLRRLAACCAPLWSRARAWARDVVRSTQLGPGNVPPGRRPQGTSYFQPCCS